MLVGLAAVDVSECIKRTKTYDDFRAYCTSLIPRDFQHVDAIVNNQCYLCCILLRKSDTMTWEQKREFCNMVMSKISTVGYVDCIIEVSSLMGAVDIQRLKKLKEGCYVRQGVVENGE